MRLGSFRCRISCFCCMSCHHRLGSGQVGSTVSWLMKTMRIRRMLDWSSKIDISYTPRRRSSWRNETLLSYSVTWRSRCIRTRRSRSILLMYSKLWWRESSLIRRLIISFRPIWVRRSRTNGGRSTRWLIKRKVSSLPRSSKQAWSSSSGPVSVSRVTVACSRTS